MVESGYCSGFEDGYCSRFGDLGNDGGDLYSAVMKEALNELRSMRMMVGWMIDPNVLVRPLGQYDGSGVCINGWTYG